MDGPLAGGGGLPPSGASSDAMAAIFAPPTMDELDEINEAVLEEA